MESFEQAKAGMGKFELKEYIESNQVKDVLRQWLNALEEDTDLEINVKGRDCTISKEALRAIKVKLEYEIKNGEYEFEMQMKWRKNEDGQVQQ